MWNYLFVIGGVLAIASLRLLKFIKEDGEVRKEIVVGEMRLAFSNKLKEKMSRDTILDLLYFPVVYPVILARRVYHRIGKGVPGIKRLDYTRILKKSA